MHNCGFDIPVEDVEDSEDHVASSVSSDGQPLSDLDYEFEKVFGDTPLEGQEVPLATNVVEHPECSAAGPSVCVGNVNNDAVTPQLKKKARFEFNITVPSSPDSTKSGLQLMSVSQVIGGEGSVRHRIEICMKAWDPALNWAPEMGQIMAKFLGVPANRVLEGKLYHDVLFSGLVTDAFAWKAIIFITS